MDIPKEVCSRQKANPRKIKRPIIKKWCYTPSPESGLDNDNNDDLTTLETPTTTDENDNETTTEEVVVVPTN